VCFKFRKLWSWITFESPSSISACDGEYSKTCRVIYACVCVCVCDGC
jgi:hypothetical protein